MEISVPDTNLKLNSILANAPGNSLIWERFLTELIRGLNCDSCFLLVTDLAEHEKTRFLYTAHIPQKYQRQYEKKLNALDAFNFYLCKNSGQIFYNQDLELTNNENFTSPCGQSHRFGLSIPCNQNHFLSLIVNRKKAFNAIESQSVRQLLNDILPNLTEAIHAEQRYKINSQLVNYLGTHFDGYIIIDHTLNILFADPVYISTIEQLDCIQISGNQFGMKNPQIENKLLSLIEHKQEAASIHNQCHSCQITLIPISCLQNLYQWECYKDGFILVFKHDIENNPTINRLTEIYRLSLCEANCAINFMKTPSISDVATTTFRSQETVRNHLKHTMQKMDVHNQAELMKKLLTVAAL